MGDEFVPAELFDEDYLWFYEERSDGDVELILGLLELSGEAVWLTERGDDLMLDKVSFDAVGGRSNTERIVVRDGKVRRTGISLAQPTAEQLTKMLQNAGFEDVQALGQTGTAYTTRSRRLVMRAR